MLRVFRIPMLLIVGWLLLIAVGLALVVGWDNRIGFDKKCRAG